MAHLPCISWVQVGGAWTLCACLTSVWIHYFSGLHAFAIASMFFFDSVVRFGSCLTLAAWKIHGSLGLRSLHSLDWALLRCRPSPSCLAHVPFFPMSVGLADDPAMPLHCSYYDHFSFISLLPLGLQAEAPTSPFSTFFLLLGFTGQHFCWANPLSTSLPLLGFIGPHSCCASPFHSLGFLGPFHSSGFLGPFSSSLPLLLV